MKSWLLPVSACLTLSLPLCADDAEEHKALRTFKFALVEALNRNDIDAMLKHLDEDVVVTFMNAEVARKPSGVKAYFDRMMKGDKARVASYRSDPVATQETKLFGTTGVAFGSSKDTFKLTDGEDFTINVQWTATVVKRGSQWKMIAFHASANVLDNPVLHTGIKRAGYWIGGLAGAGSLLVGLVLGLIFRRCLAGTSP